MILAKASLNYDRSFIVPATVIMIVNYTLRSYFIFILEKIGFSIEIALLTEKRLTQIACVNEP